MGVYDFNVTTINQEKQSLRDYEGDVLLIVNTATKCGLKNQFNGLQQLHDTYKDQGFTVLGFPSNQFLNQEPGTDEDINQTCQMNFGVTFPLFSKINVNGKNAHPLFTYLTQEAPGVMGGKIKWNFTKFLINRQGEVVERFAPKTEPEKIEEFIKEQLEKS
ncbi:glutathione peroxidase [Pelagirhabdus alkalitolerans]|uniref:Glutathione peroxidase n=1 Tax=Pelagirhabdus alkalitolerans TaxID=1612202 RepID=A0A1G6JIJ1_9BACI|nr:glutathione peroxidase [Pelagirhabdus alkalitolerans]SDC18487.1 glutathione peroxidase [Pelagirhabdus alkalitolerans]